MAETYEDAAREGTHVFRVRLATAATVAALLAITGGALLDAGHRLLAAAAIAAGFVFARRARRAWRDIRFEVAAAAAHYAVRRELGRLLCDGWTVGECVPWLGTGSVAHTARSRIGLGFAIEISAEGYDDAELHRVRSQAAWFAGEGASRLRFGAHPVLCLSDARVGFEVLDRGVIVCSPDRVAALLRANERQRLSGSLEVGSPMLSAIPRDARAAAGAPLAR
jgi:hypothetical protein